MPIWTDLILKLTDSEGKMICVNIKIGGETHWKCLYH